MGGDRKKEDDNQFCHIVLALRRLKDNQGLKQKTFREVVQYNDVETTIKKLEARIDKEEGVWRIHKTINKRDKLKAGKLLQKMFIDDYDKTSRRVEQEWKTCLLQPKCKGERNILLDIDSAEAMIKVNEILDCNRIHTVDETLTPNGNHVVINAEEVDTRLFQNIKDVTFQRDGYIFIKIIDKGDIK